MSREGNGTMTRKTLVFGMGAGLCAAVCAATSPDMPPEIFKPGETILFQGDSITHGGRQGDMNHFLGHGYQALISYAYLANRPDLRLKFLNRAVSGDTTEKMLARWDRDALAPVATEWGYGYVFGMTNVLARGGSFPLRPDWLSILAGVNDYHFARNCSPEAYETNLVQLVERARAANPKLKIVLGEPFGVPQYATDRFARMQAAAAKVALRYGLPLVPYQKLFNEDLMKLVPQPGYWSWDTVHPTYAAHARMAGLWMRTVADWCASPVTNTCLIPQGQLERDSYDWFKRHCKILELQRKLDPEVVFVGDSITHFWAGRHTVGEAADASGKPSDLAARWKEAFGAYRTLNIGFGWDRIQNVLWRLAHGEMDGVSPKAIVLHIGTNNVGGTPRARANSPAEIAEGTLEVVRRLHEKAPDAQVILMAVFPRGQKAGGHWRKVTAASNAILRDLVKDDPKTTWLDIGEKLVDENGDIPKSVMFDFCHPTTNGYAIWAEAIKPHLVRTVGH